MNFLCSYFAICLTLLVTLGYVYVKRKYSYWQRHKIGFIEPKFPFGNLRVIRRTEHLSQRLARFYIERKHDAPMLGIYFMLSPILLITDLELIRHIFIKDFQYFRNRGIFYNEKHDPLSAHLFNVDYEKWRPLRSKLTPTFTSGKMKFMFGTIVAVADEFVACLNRSIQIDSEMEVNEWLGRFTTDVIGTCAFGIECNSLKDPQAKFREMGRKVFDQPKLNTFERMLIMSCKSLAKLLRICTHHKDVTDFFLNIVNETIEYRENNNVQRNDFMSLLIELKNAKNDTDRLTINEIAAQAFVFFLAGFETTSTTLTYCLYELALDKHKHIQDKARQEIVTVLDKHNGNLTYEAINEMTYIDQIINETLRKHPPASNLARMATSNYKLPNSNYTVPEGMMVIIPVYGIHHDPEIYENPEKFDPNRFTPEQIQQRPSCTFLPFGEGPRNCIGLRFGMLQARIGLVKLLQNFEFSTCTRTQIPIKYSPKKLVLSPENGVWLKITGVKN
ncbi:probable cytochrome P450 6a20 [Contarinia nasturtii]|uniref:probable cytochrome P450 6a20 n=1 Tax=Contarinia nasturtii TaxID=265458 RepID=UPI0012D3BC14|nr:probable cytochrome P450 6a20 [Contarinia nasturtii]